MLDPYINHGFQSMETNKNKIWSSIGTILVNSHTFPKIWLPKTPQILPRSNKKGPKKIP